jgi:hypothetical protein
VFKVVLKCAFRECLRLLDLMGRGAWWTQLRADHAVQAAFIQW